MKITTLTTTWLQCPFTNQVRNGTAILGARDVLLVHLGTDTGIEGLGFLTGLSVAGGNEIAVIREVIEHGLRPLVVGEDPFTTERLWQSMYQKTTRYGRRGAVVRAISGVDIALWDIIGKATGQSVHRLVGGYRDQVPCYASGGYYRGEGDIPLLLEEMTGYVRAGFTAVKMKVGASAPEDDLVRVRAVREAIGPRVKLMVDVNEAWDVVTAMRMLQPLHDLDVFWLEEPLAPDDVAGYGRLVSAAAMPVVAGENEYTRFGFLDLIQKGALIIQADVTRVGGVTEWIRVAHLASAHHIQLAPHGVQELHLQLVAAVHNGYMVEYFAPEHPLQEFLARLFVQPAQAQQPRAGWLDVPSAPGWGLVYDPELAEHYKV